MRKLLVSLATGFLLASPAKAAQELTPEASALTAEGVRLHDAGDFEGAIARYTEALEYNPGAPGILYERAFSYMAAGDYDLCIADARQALGSESPLEADLWALVGNCNDDQGRFDEALAAYEEGLAGYPESVGLNYNIAVALMRTGDDARAREHLKTTLRVEPNHPSANALLAGLFREGGYRIPALFQLLRFVTVEFLTPRSAGAANEILNVMGESVTSGEEGNIRLQINVDAPTDEGDFGPLELVITFLESTRFLTDADTPADSPAGEAVGRVDSILTVTREQDDPQLRETFVWKHAIDFLGRIQDAGHLEAMGYIAFANLEGAQAWIMEHQMEVAAWLEWQRANATRRQ